MALWGNKDRKPGDGSIQSVDALGNVVGSGTAFTTQAKIGNTIYTDGREYLIIKIVDDTNCIVRSGVQGGEIEVGSSYSYTLSEKPAFMAASESGSSSGVSGDSANVFGVDTAESFDSAGRIVEIGVATGGARYTEVPAVSISLGGGGSAAATATILEGSVNLITMTNVGGSYETVPMVTIDLPRRTIPAADINTTSEVITYTGHGLSAGDAVKYFHGGGTAATGLTNNTTYYVIASGLTADAFKVSATDGGGAVNISGTGNNAQYFELATTPSLIRATAVANVGGGTDAGESRTGITHAGWVRRTVGTGGRAGRVQYETLVAMGSISGDQADDTKFQDD
jgi:hypothetical protein